MLPAPRVEGVKLDTDERTLEARRKSARTRFLIAVVLSACTAVLGVIGLLIPGRPQIFGLLSLLASALLLSYALRQRAKRDAYGWQLDELHGKDAAD